MDRLIPGFLGTLSSQKIKGTRVLLKYRRRSAPGAWRSREPPAVLVRT